MKANNLKVVDSNQTDEQKLEQLKITRLDVQQHVLALRAELETYADQLNAAPFDILADDEPRSLQEHKRKWTVDLIDNLNPLVKDIEDAINQHAPVLGDLSFDLKRESAEVGFKIGVLFGAILAGCDRETIDKFTRGLVFDLSCHPELIKQPPKPLL